MSTITTIQTWGRIAQPARERTGGPPSYTEEAANKNEDGFDEHEIGQKARSDVRALAMHVRQIRESFVRIYQDLLGFDEEDFRKKNGQKVPPLLQGWRELMDRFEDIIHASTINAVKAAAFIKVVLPVLEENASSNDGPTVYDLKEELSYFLEQLRKHESSASDTKRNFNNLVRDVYFFSARVKDTLSQAEGGVRDECEKSQKRVDDLTKKLDQLTEELNTMRTTTISSFCVGARKAVAALFTLSPSTGRAAFGSFVESARSGKRWLELRREIKDVTAEKDQAIKKNRELIEKEATLGRYIPKLISAQEKLNDAAKKIDIITNIWHTINMDMSSISTVLETVANPDAPVTKYFHRKLEPAHRAYQCLKICLEIYAEESQAI